MLDWAKRHLAAILLVGIVLSLAGHVATLVMLREGLTDLQRAGVR